MGSPWVNDDFTYDLSDNVLFEKDEENYIHALGIQQLNTIGNLYLLDIFLSEGNSIELHYHPNATELIYCIAGEVEIAFINPNNNEWQRFMLNVGDVVSIPQGFWHYVRSLTDDTHVLATFDTNNLETIFGSDLLRITPNEVFADLYRLNEEEVANTLAPIDETVIIGPPEDCAREESAVEGVSEAELPGMIGKPVVEGAGVERPSNRNESVKAERMMDVQRNNLQMNQMAEELPNQEAGVSNQMAGASNQMTKEGPIMYGGTIMREMNLCADCLRHYES